MFTSVNKSGPSPASLTVGPNKGPKSISGSSEKEKIDMFSSKTREEKTSEVGNVSLELAKPLMPAAKAAHEFPRGIPDEIICQILEKLDPESFVEFTQSREDLLDAALNLTTLKCQFHKLNAPGTPSDDKETLYKQICKHVRIEQQLTIGPISSSRLGDSLSEGFPFYSFSPNGENLLLGATKQKSSTLYKLGKLPPVAQSVKAVIVNYAFSPNSQFLSTIVRDETADQKIQIVIQEISNLSSSFLILPVDDDYLILGSMFSPNCDYFAAPTLNDEILLWDIRDGIGRPVDVPSRYSPEIEPCFFGSGHLLFAAQQTRKAVILDLALPETVPPGTVAMTEFEEPVKFMRASKGGNFVYIQYRNSSARLWETSLQAPTHLYSHIDVEVELRAQVTFSDDSRFLAIAYDGEAPASVWDTTKKPASRIDASFNLGPLESVVFSSDSHFALVIPQDTRQEDELRDSQDNRIAHVVDLSSKNLTSVKLPAGENEACATAKFLFGSRFVLVTSDCGEPARIWDGTKRPPTFIYLDGPLFTDVEGLSATAERPVASPGGPYVLWQTDTNDVILSSFSPGPDKEANNE